MPSTGWIFEDTWEGVDYREYGPEGDTTLQKRTIQFFSRFKIWTGGDTPASLVGGSEVSSISAGTYTSTGSYVCTKDHLKRLGPPGSGLLRHEQQWEEYDKWEDM